MGGWEGGGREGGGGLLRPALPGATWAAWWPRRLPQPSQASEAPAACTWLSVRGKCPRRHHAATLLASCASSGRRSPNRESLQPGNTQHEQLPSPVRDRILAQTEIGY